MEQLVIAALNALGEIASLPSFPAATRVRAAEVLLAYATEFQVENDPEPGTADSEEQGDAADIIAFPQGERLTPEEALARHQAFAAQEQEDRDTPPETSGGSSFGSGPQRPA